MASKPTVALALSESMASAMFTEPDLARLRSAAEIAGPVGKEDPEGLKRALSEAVVAITGWGSPKFGRELLDAAPKLKLVAYSAGSVKAVVTDEMYDRGIKITTSAGGNAIPVAQFTVSMMVSMLKQVPWLHEAMRRNDKAEIDRRRVAIRELMHIDVGLVGASRVGREVIKLLHGYPHVNIKLYDPYLPQEEAERLRLTLCPLEEVCACPVVSIHAPNIAETRHMFNARTLGLLPDHAVLINTARGALVDEAALLAEVRKRPLYVLLDVTDPEPAPADSPLRRETNVLLTPHVAGALQQARKEMGRLAIDETLRFLAGERLTCEVTREMLPTQA